MNQRTRVVSREDPAQVAQVMSSMTGLEVVRAIFDRAVPAPPMGLLLGLEGVEAEEGRAVLAVELAEYHSNNAGAAHGGLAATLVDAAVTSAVMTTLPRNMINTTLQLSTYYIRPLMLDGGPITVEGTVIHRGRGTATATAEVRHGTGRLCVQSTGTCLIRTFDPAAQGTSESVR